jgi:hypothetical protein
MLATRARPAAKATHLSCSRSFPHARRQRGQPGQEAHGGSTDTSREGEPCPSAWLLPAQREPDRVAHCGRPDPQGQERNAGAGQPGGPAPARGRQAPVGEHQQHKRDKSVGGPPGPQTQPRRHRAAGQRAWCGGQRVVDVLIADHTEGAAEPDSQEQPSDRVCRAVGGHDGAQQHKMRPPPQHPRSSTGRRLRRARRRAAAPGC